MTIRKRLILSYIAMVLIPIVLFFMIASLLAWLFFGEMTENDSSKGHSNHPIPSIRETFDQRDQLLSGVKFMAQHDSGRLTDIEFLQEVDEAFNQLQAGLVVVKNNSVLYASPLVDSVDLYDQIKRYEIDAGKGWGERISDRFTVDKHDFTFADQSAGSIYLLSDLNPFFERMWRFLPILLLSLLIVVGLTNGLLTYLVSRSIIKPLYTLKRAAEQIKEGNLDHGLNLSRKDEIGEVGEAFEEMRKRLKQSIGLQLQYEENRKELISNISHDLKTPITGIKASVEGIRDGIADTEEKRDKYIQMIDKKATDMDYLIDELFLFSKLDLKRLPFHYEKMDIADYLRDCVQELQLDPRLKNVVIDAAIIEDKQIYVRGDREKLQRVIMNIVNNSMKYMLNKDNNIQIGLVEGEDEVTISIRDNGAGIERDALPHIFDRFYRAEPSRNTLTGGSGLGLAIVKHIVEEHDGRTWAESQIGAGTTISFTLPLDIKERSGGEQS